MVCVAHCGHRIVDVRQSWTRPDAERAIAAPGARRGGANSGPLRLGPLAHWPCGSVGAVGTAWAAVAGICVHRDSIQLWQHDSSIEENKSHIQPNQVVQEMCN